jgi:hypothetical protein
MDLESRIRLAADQVIVEDVLAEIGGQVVRREDDPVGLYWAVLQPTATGVRPFIARVLWSLYPDQPPSVLFADQIGGQTSMVFAWPAANGYRAPNDICKPFTAEGQALHPEWASGHHRWRPEGNPFLFVIEALQDDIDRVDGRRAA